MQWHTIVLILPCYEGVIFGGLSGIGIKEPCRRFGISLMIGQEWWQRYREAGDVARQKCSHRPLHSSQWTSARMTLAAIAFRMEQPVWSGRKLRHRFHDLGKAALPAASAFPMILRRGRVLGVILRPSPGAWTAPLQRPFADGPPRRL